MPIIINVIISDTLCTTIYPTKFIFVFSLFTKKKHLMALYDTVMKNTLIRIVNIFISIISSSFLTIQFRNKTIGNTINTVTKRINPTSVITIFLFSYPRHHPSYYILLKIFQNIITVVNLLQP